MTNCVKSSYRGYRCQKFVSVSQLKLYHACQKQSWQIIHSSKDKIWKRKMSLFKILSNSSFSCIECIKGIWWLTVYTKNILFNIFVTEPTSALCSQKGTIERIWKTDRYSLKLLRHAWQNKMHQSSITERTHQFTYTMPRSQSEHFGVSDGTFVGR